METAYLIVQLSTNGQVVNYDIYSEASPTCLNTLINLVVDKASASSFEEARRVLLSNINNRLNPPLISNCYKSSVYNDTHGY